MVIDDDARKVLGWDATTNIDPSAATVELQIGSVRYPMTWTGPATAGAAEWERRAQTDGMLVGSRATAQVGDIVLGAGRHEAQVILTLPDGQVLPARSFTIHVS